jgi:uncharacterized membrane protein
MMGDMRFASPRIATFGIGLAVVALALVLRVEAARDEFWIDEYITAWTITESWGETWQRAGISHQPPLYNLLLYGLSRFFGESTWMLRMPSLLAGMSLVVLIACLAYQFTASRTASLAAGFLAAIDQHFVFYGSEARSYACVQLLGLIAVVASRNLVDVESNANRRLESGSGPQAMVLVVSLVAMFYLHYTSIVLIVALAIVGTTYVIRNPKRAPAWWLAIVATALACIPGWFELAAIGQRSEDWKAIGSFADLWKSLPAFIAIYLLPAAVACALRATRGRAGAKMQDPGPFFLAVLFTTIVGVVIVKANPLAPFGLYR